MKREGREQEIDGLKQRKEWSKKDKDLWWESVKAGE